MSKLKLDNREVIATNVYGRLVKNKDKYYLFAHERCCNNVLSFNKYVLHLLELLDVARIKKFELKANLNGYGLLKIEVKPLWSYKKKHLKK